MDKIPFWLVSLLVYTIGGALMILVLMYFLKRFYIKHTNLLNRLCIILSDTII